jgi:hypothetical protein
MLMLGTTMLSFPWPAAARTAASTCRSACAPRITEQCGGLTGAALRRCRRPLVRACKATTPAIACETTDEMTRALGDRLVRFANPTGSTLTLCQSGQFFLSVPDPNSTPDDPSVGDEAFGTWAVHVVGGGLGLVLADSRADAPRRLERDATGGLLVDGVPAQLDDATTTCATTTFDPNETQRATLVVLARALTDRTLALQDGSGDEITLCSSGRAIHESGNDETDGTWTLDVEGSNLLVLHEGTSDVVFGVDVTADGAVSIDSTAVELRDARPTCADRDLVDRLTAALNGKVFHITIQLVTVPVQVTLGFCDTGRFALGPRHGSWSVFVANGAPALRLVDDQGLPLLNAFAPALDADGNPTVRGTPPVDDPNGLAAACQG